MRRVALALAAVAALAGGSAAAGRALRATGAPPPGLSIAADRPLFSLAGLRHGDRAARCLTATSEGSGDAYAAIAGRVEHGDLARFLRVAVTRGCGGGTLLYAGPLTGLAASDPAPWRAGERRRFGFAVEVAGTDREVQGRRAVHAFVVTARAEAVRSACRRVALARGRRRVLVKRRRIDARVHAKLFIGILGPAGGERLLIVTGLRVGRRVLPGRRWGAVRYRVNDGAAVTSRRRPFAIRVAPAVLRRGRNVVRVTIVPRGRAPVHARYVLTLGRAGGRCVLR